jgi:tetratricopeptide (TPR) repeat protein
MKKILINLLAVLFLSASCASQPTSSEAKEETGMQPQKQRELSSIDAPTDESQLTPDKLKARGIQAYTSGNFPEAATLIQTALLLDHQLNEPGPKFLIVYSSLMSGDYPRALSVAQSLANEFPYHPIVYQQIGLAEMEMGNLNEALSAFEKALDFESHTPRVHFYMGVIQAQLGKKSEADRFFQEGEREYKDILRFNPKDFSANYELASLYLFHNVHIEETGALLQNCRESLSTRTQDELPISRPIYTNFYLPLIEGIYAYRKNNWELAESRLKTALTHMPTGAKADAAELYFYLAKVHAAQHQDPEAKSFFDVAISMDPHGVYAAEAGTASSSITSR